MAELGRLRLPGEYMLGTILIVVVLLLLIGAFPRWVIVAAGAILQAEA
jgi:uncharacterized membrane protein YkgB